MAMTGGARDLGKLILKSGPRCRGQSLDRLSNAASRHRVNVRLRGCSALHAPGSMPLIRACRLELVINDSRRDIRPDYLDADSRPTESGRAAITLARSLGYST